MTTLLYRGQSYEPQRQPAAKRCVQLTYRREHYNTCRKIAAAHPHAEIKYRGIAVMK